MPINKKNKRLEITLTDEELSLINSLASRFSITKSQVIKQAIKVFASKRKHYMTISYKEIQDDEITKGQVKSVSDKPTKKISRDEFYKLLEENEESNQPTEDNDLPF